MPRYLKILIAFVAITPIVFYALVILAVLYIEATYLFDTTPRAVSVLERVPGTWIVENKKDPYCLSKGSGKLLRAYPELSKYCDKEIGKIHRVYVYSRIIRKSWSFFIDDNGVVRKKNSWVTM